MWTSIMLGVGDLWQAMYLFYQQDTLRKELIIFLGVIALILIVLAFFVDRLKGMHLP